MFEHSEHDMTYPHNGPSKHRPLHPIVHITDSSSCQNAFRSLLSKPRPSESSSSSARGVLGGPAPKRGWGIKPKPGHEYKDPSNDAGDAAPAFKPRQQGKKPGTSGGKYQDRAEMRRRGIDDEYKPVSRERIWHSGVEVMLIRQVEQLLEDLEKRNAEEGADAGEVGVSHTYAQSISLTI